MNGEQLKLMLAKLKLSSFGSFYQDIAIEAEREGWSFGQLLFIPAFKLVQRLLIAKQELRLEKELKKLDRFDAIIIDDIGYIQQGRDEMEVLFTFLAERYERKSVMISSNLVFSQWDRIFKDPMTTAAAVDRLVHHSVILEMNQDSYRANKAKESIETEQKNNGKTKSNVLPNAGLDC